jgi:hypothetical protein
MTKPFNADNWEATQEQIDKANEAYAIASVKFFEGVDPEDTVNIERHKKWLCDKIGNAFSDGLSAGEIANWALSK